MVKKQSVSSHQSSNHYRRGGRAGRHEVKCYLVPTYSLASCSTVPLGADVIRDSE